MEGVPWPLPFGSLFSCLQPHHLSHHVSPAEPAVLSPPRLPHHLDGLVPTLTLSQPWAYISWLHGMVLDITPGSVPHLPS